MVAVAPRAGTGCLTVTRGKAMFRGRFICDRRATESSSILTEQFATAGFKPAAVLEPCDHE